MGTRKQATRRAAENDEVPCSATFTKACTHLLGALVVGDIDSARYRLKQMERYVQRHVES